jgi:hypothetical protein
MENWPSWELLSAEEPKAVLNGIVDMTNEILEDPSNPGRVSDEVMYHHLGDIFGILNNGIDKEANILDILCKHLIMQKYRNNTHEVIKSISRNCIGKSTNLCSEICNILKYYKDYTFSHGWSL